MDIPTALARSWLGNHLDERVLMEGRATPSASPKNARTARRAKVEWLAAHGVSRVARDHKATPHAITLFPPYLSTRAPPTTDENMYPHRKDDCTMPKKELDQPNLVARGTTVTDITTRSALHKHMTHATKATTLNLSGISSILLAAASSLPLSLMAAKSALHSSSPNTSSFLNSKSDLVHFRRTQLRFEPRIPSKPIKWESCSRTREQSREKVKQGGRLFTVRCTAEGIERGMLIGGGRGREEAAASKILDIPERFKVVALVACVMCLCNADRVVMSVTVVPLATKFGWSSSFLGIVQSSFLWGYIFSSVVGGALVDRYGGKRVMAWGVALWSLATLLTPWAANHSTFALLAVRAFFGLAEGVALPSMSTLSSRWFPSHERASAVGISMAGFHLGNVIGLLLTPIMLSTVGISGPFILFSSLGLLWLTRWANGVTSDPRDSPFVSKSELRLIQAGKTDSPASDGQFPPLRLLLSKAPSWAIIFANITNNWGYFVLLSWMPIYFNTVFNVNLKQAAWFSAVPWGTMAVSGYVAGALSDSLIKAGYSLTIVRKIMQSIGFIGPGVSLLCLNYAKTPVTAAALMTIALSLSSFSQAGFLLNMQDIAPQYAGFLHGIANSAGTLAAIISTIGTGYFVQWLGSFQAFLTVTAGLYFVTAIFWNLYATGERVF